jgi:nicotinamide-nucleotide amidase
MESEDIIKSLVDKIDYGMRASNSSLSIVESITGGLLSSLITQKEGVSSWYHGSLCLYSKLSKVKVLQLPNNITTVGTDITAMMAKQIYTITKTSITLAITGEAGPNISDNKYNIGDVFISITKNGEQYKSLALNLKGSRISIQKQAAIICLKEINNIIES